MGDEILKIVKSRWVILSVLVLFVMVLVGTVFQNSIKESAYSHYGTSTDLKSVSYEGYRLGQSFKNNGQYQQNSGDTESQLSYDHYGMGVADFTTDLQHKVIAMELLDKSTRFNTAFSNGIRIYGPFKRAEQVLGTNYVTFTTERFGKVAEYVDRKKHYKLLFGLSERNKITAIAFFDTSQYAYQL